LTQENEKISSNQLGVLLFSYLTGSSIVNIPGPLIASAKNGAWISLLLALTAGFLLLLCMLYLNRLYPQYSFIELSRELLGYWITGGLVIVLLVPFMIYMCTGITLDIGLFLKSSLMRETPLYIFCGFIFGLAALTVRCGIEVITRMFTLLVTIVMLFTVAVWALALPDYHVNLLLPIIPDGLMPVLKGAYTSYGFPYAEIFLFLFLFASVRKDEQRKLGKPLILALFLNGGTLIISTLSTLMIFGPLAGDRRFSLFEVARIVEVQEIIQRIESVIGMSLIAGSYMKVTITLLILNKACIELLKLRDQRILVYPLTLICYLIAINFTGDARWINMVSVIQPLWITVAFVVPLLLLTGVAAVKHFLVHTPSSDESST
jgi:spore germination protein KB